MFKNLKITISPDGGEMSGLYDEHFNWKDFGELEIERATDITFNKKRQLWVVKIIDEGMRELDFGYTKRSDAVLAEIEYLNKRGMYI
jgi:hypothetical protein